MNDCDGLITDALRRRFARAGTPACPDGAWQAAAFRSASNVLPRRASRRLAYAAALLGTAAIGALAAQASDTVKASYAQFVLPFFVSSKPLAPAIHAADRLTIAEAQRHMPFSIVVPAGLPERSRFMYAHVLREKPNASVALTYEAHIGGRYYRISFNESTVAVGPPVTRFEFRWNGHATKASTLPHPRWKHGSVIIDLFAWGLPADASNQIVRANTL
ncbi:MAG: hypothetical protein ABR591_08280 [Candidatus Velthaea sp.]